MPETIYKHIEVKKLEEVTILANWLRLNSHGPDKAISMAYHPKRGAGVIALANRDEVVSVSLGGPFEEAILGPLRSTMLDQNLMEVRYRDMYLDLVDFTRLFSKKFKMDEEDVFNRLSPFAVGDLRSAANVIGLQTVEKKRIRSAADDAYEIALYEPQYAHNISQYYSKVSLPFARLQAEATLLTDKGKKDWFVSYPQLWLRVFTHFTADPTLTWAFTQERDILETVSGVLEVTPVQAEALLFWQAHGRDLSALSARFPKVVDDLPANLPWYATELDKHFPVLVSGVLRMQQQYIDTRASHTLYGRMLRFGPPPGEAAAFKIFGTVEDILSVSMVSLWQNRIAADIRIAGVEGGPSDSVIRINGVGPTAGKDYWTRVLTDISPLNNPITIPLAPTAVMI